MPPTVLDASALLAVLFREAGMEAALPHVPGAFVSAVNLSEVAARCVERGKPLGEVEALLAELPLQVVPFDTRLAYLAAGLRVPTRPFGLSLGDRSCLALGMDKRALVLTTDGAWSRVALDLEIRQLR